MPAPLHRVTPQTGPAITPSKRSGRRVVDTLGGGGGGTPVAEFTPPVEDGLAIAVAEGGTGTGLRTLLTVLERAATR